MCTLIALHRCVDRAGLVIAANRDEFYDRPSEGPALRSTQFGSILAPLDARAGGTWFGVNERGVFAALTNRPCEDADARRKSRGHVVIDALAACNAEQAADRLTAIGAGVHNPFNAFVADGESAFALVYEESGALSKLEPGAHVIGNVDPDDRSNPKVARVLDRAEAAAGGTLDAALDALAEACREKNCGSEAGSLGDTCVHTPTYGTRSSLLMSLDPQSGSDRFRYAEGPPCENDYEDFTPLLNELTRRGSYAAGDELARTAQ